LLSMTDLHLHIHVPFIFSDARLVSVAVASH
jgi:hypothetical protein